MSDLTIDDVLYAIETCSDKKTAYEMAVSAGVDERENKDARRWNIGDLAALLDKRYGENITGQYAQDIGEPAKTVYEYRSMALFYEKSARQKIFEDYPTATYSLMRTARRFERLDSAVAFIEMAVDNDFSVERATVEAKLLLGKRVPPKKHLKKVKARLTHVDTYTGDITLRIAPGVSIIHLLEVLNEDMHVELTALKSEVSNEA